MLLRLYWIISDSEHRLEKGSHMVSSPLLLEQYTTASLIPELLNKHLKKLCSCISDCSGCTLVNQCIYIRAL